MLDLKSLVESLEKEELIPQETPKEIPQPEISTIPLEPEEPETLIEESDFEEMPKVSNNSTESDIIDLLNKIYIKLDKLQNSLIVLTSGKNFNTYSSVLPSQQYSGTVTPVGVGGTAAYNKYVKIGEEAEQIFKQMGVNDAFSALEAMDGPKIASLAQDQPLPPIQYPAGYLDKVNKIQQTANNVPRYATPLPSQEQRYQAPRMVTAPQVVLSPQVVKPVSVPPPIPSIAKTNDFDFKKIL